MLLVGEWPDERRVSGHHNEVGSLSAEIWPLFFRKPPVEAKFELGRVVAQYGLLHREPQWKHSDVIPLLLGVAQRARFNSITKL